MASKSMDSSKREKDNQHDFYLRAGTLIVSCLTLLLLIFNTFFDVRLKSLSSEQKEIEIRNLKPEFKVEYITLSKYAYKVFEDPNLLAEIDYSPLHHPFIINKEISNVLDNLCKQEYENSGECIPDVSYEDNFGLTCLIIEQIGIGYAHDVKLITSKIDEDLYIDMISHGYYDKQELKSKSDITVISLGSLGRNEGRIIPLYVNNGSIDMPEKIHDNLVFKPLELTYTDIDNITKTYNIRNESDYKIYISPNIYSGE